MQQLQQRAAAPRPHRPAPSEPAGSAMHEVVHDARSMVTALGLYCDLLSEPGVLAAAHRHYLDELRLLAAASRSVVERLGVLSDWRELSAPGYQRRQRQPLSAETSAVALAGFEGSAAGLAVTALPGTRRSGLDSGLNSGFADSLPPVPIANLAAELRASRSLLEAMAGPGIPVGLRIDGGELPVRLSSEELTRVLVNLVKNAAEAMPSGGRIEIRLRERRKPGHPLLLTLEDNGPGIPEVMLERVFAPRFTTKSEQSAGWSAAHRGLGLSITRSILEAAGGKITAVSGAHGGARLEIELPVRTL